MSNVSKYNGNPTNTQDGVPTTSFASPTSTDFHNCIERLCQEVVKKNYFQIANGIFSCLRCNKTWKDRALFCVHLWEHLHKSKIACNNCFAPAECHSVKRLTSRLEETLLKPQTENSNEVAEPIVVEANRGIQHDSGTTHKSPICVDVDDEPDKMSTKENETVDNPQTSKMSPMEKVKRFIANNGVLTCLPNENPQEFAKKKQQMVVDIKAILKKVREDPVHKVLPTDEERAAERLKLKLDILRALRVKHGLPASTFNENSIDSSSGIQRSPLISEPHADRIMPLSSSLSPEKYGNNLPSISDDIGEPAMHPVTEPFVIDFPDWTPPQFFACSVCRFSTLIQNEFKDHLLKNHLQQNLMCIHCGYRAESIDQLMKHFKHHTTAINPGVPTYACLDTVCKFQCNILHDFLVHMDCHPNYTAKCHCCTNSFKSLRELHQHYYSSLMTIVKCRYCNARASDKRSALKHIATDHPDKGRMVGITKHLICQERKDNSYSFDKMVEIVKGLLSTTQDDVEGDSQYIPEVVSVESIGHEKSAKSSGIKRYRKPSSTSPSREKMKETGNQKVIDDSNNQNETHFQGSTISLISTYQELQLADDLGFKCDQCSFVADRKTSLDDHLAKHRSCSHPFEDDKDFCCMFCPTTFNELADLENHLQHHDERISFEFHECTLDGFRTNRPQNVKAHLQDELHEMNAEDLITKGTVTMETKVIQCSSCPYKCVGKKYMRDHQIKHHASSSVKLLDAAKSPESRAVDPPDNSDSSKSTKSKSVHKAYPSLIDSSKEYFDLFEEHISQLYRSENNALACNLCNKTFKYKRTLYIHLDKHLNIPFRCEICDFEDSLYTLVTSHMSLTHEVNNVAVTFSEDLQDKVNNMLSCISPSKQDVNNSTTSPKQVQKKSRRITLRGSTGIKIITVPKKVEISLNPDVLESSEVLQFTGVATANVNDSDSQHIKSPPPTEYVNHDYEEGVIRSLSSQNTPDQSKKRHSSCDDGKPSPTNRLQLDKRKRHSSSRPRENTSTDMDPFSFLLNNLDEAPPHPKKIRRNSGKTSQLYASSTSPSSIHSTSFSNLMSNVGCQSPPSSIKKQTFTESSSDIIDPNDINKTPKHPSTSTDNLIDSNEIKLSPPSSHEDEFDFQGSRPDKQPIKQSPNPTKKLTPSKLKPKIKFDFSKAKKRGAPATDSISFGSRIKHKDKTSTPAIYQCPRCPFETSFNKEVMTNHLKSHKIENVYECKKCSVKFHSFDLIQSHQNFLHRNDQDNEISFLPVKNIPIVALFKEKEKEIEPPPSSPSPSKTNSQKSKKRKTDVGSNVQPAKKSVKVPTESLKCRHCHKGFSALFDLSKHYSLKHTNKKRVLWTDVATGCVFVNGGHVISKPGCHHILKFLCYFCAFRGKTRNIIKEHQKKKHAQYSTSRIIKLSDVDETIGATCDSEYSSSVAGCSSSKIPQKTKVKFKYICPLCSYSINKIYVYSQHLAKHRLFYKVVKTWKCSVCKFIIRKKSNFEQHMCALETASCASHKSTSLRVPKKVRTVDLKPSVVLTDLRAYL